MNTQKQKNKKSEIYCSSGFKDTLASPVFYPVIVVSLVLGITSIFGFIQNPLKLKTIVSVIHQKVAVSNLVNDSLKTDLYKINMKEESKKESTDIQSIEILDLFPNTDQNYTKKMPLEGSHERIAFNYDITSESFWADLDSSKIESAAEEIERKEKEAATFGTPLQLDHKDTEFNINDDTIYALKKSNKT